MFDSNVIDESTLTLPKDMKGDKVVATKSVPKYTIGINRKDKTIFRTNTIQYMQSDVVNLCYVGDRCISIDTRGNVVFFNPLDIPVRSSIKSRGINSSIVAVGNCLGEAAFIAYSFSFKSSKNR